MPTDNTLLQYVKARLEVFQDDLYGPYPIPLHPENRARRVMGQTFLMNYRYFLNFASADDLTEPQREHLRFAAKDMREWLRWHESIHDTLHPRARG